MSNALQYLAVGVAISVGVAPPHVHPHGGRDIPCGLRLSAAAEGPLNQAPRQPSVLRLRLCRHQGVRRDDPRQGLQHRLYAPGDQYDPVAPRPVILDLTQRLGEEPGGPVLPSGFAPPALQLRLEDVGVAVVEYPAEPLPAEGVQGGIEGDPGKKQRRLDASSKGRRPVEPEVQVGSDDVGRAQGTVYVEEPRGIALARLLSVGGVDQLSPSTAFCTSSVTLRASSAVSPLSD